MSMFKVFSAVAILALAPLAAAAQQPAHDWLVIPNTRVGPITASSTEQGLREAFGGMFVSTKRVSGEMETHKRVSLIYRDDFARAISVSWAQDGKREHPETVLFCFGVYGVTGLWHTRSGIRCGTTMHQLEALNGRPFTLTGYGRDLAGTVESWQGGALEGELGPKGALEISVEPGDPGWQRKLTDAERAILERESILSSDPVVQKLSSVVYRMVFKFMDSPGSSPGHLGRSDLVGPR
ncbi:MAG TPA: hypothetical protein VGP62_13525 [Bryobacteraceae bacterium]|jgi:hypothetical protein|nr:hypothetical protein [Bryobacteraceae bacterium]